MIQLRCIAAWMLFALLVFGVSAVPLLADESGANGGETGELRIDGVFVERLRLKSRDGRTHTIDPSAQTMTLPQGEYKLHEVLLHGGYRSWRSNVQRTAWVHVGPDRQATLQVGAPLVQRVRLARKGAVLTVGYELIGRGGERYHPSGKPGFIVYRGDREVFSTDFEFG